MSARVTTVVITRDRRDQLLETLARHDGPVVVVDNGSTDGTPEAVRERFPAVVLVCLPRNRGAAGRTVGARVATTPYIAFADDDSWWEPGSLDLAADVLDRHAPIALLAARVVVEPEGREDPFNSVLAGSPVPGDPTLPGVPILGFMACAVVVRRDDFLAAGGFEERLGIGGEEQLLAWDLASAGRELRYDQRLMAHHQPRPSPARGARRQAGLVTSSVLAAVMRRGWSDVGRQVVRGLRGSGPDRVGVLRAIGTLPFALRHRRVMSSSLRAQVRALQG